jgi:septal ring factor EnvC (AmiA/AmiB activator)
MLPYVSLCLSLLTPFSSFPQISALRDGLRQAKEDLDAARKGREKLMKARQTAQEETENLESQVARAEAQASAAQEALSRTRRYVFPLSFFHIPSPLCQLTMRQGFGRIKTS